MPRHLVGAKVWNFGCMLCADPESWGVTGTVHQTWAKWLLLLPTCHIFLYHWLMPSVGSTLQRPGSWQMLKRQPAAEMALPPLVPLLRPPARSPAAAAAAAACREAPSDSLQRMYWSAPKGLNATSLAGQKAGVCQPDKQVC